MELDQEALAQEAERINAMSDETERDAAITRYAKKSSDPAKAFDNLSTAISELQAESKSTLAADVETFNTPIGTIRTEVGTGLNQDGLTGGNASLFTGVMDNEYGAASVGATGNMNGQGKLDDPTVSARYVSPALINDKESRFEAVGIGAVGVTVPTTERDFTGADVSLAAGGVVFDKPTGVAITGLVSTDAAGKDPALWGRLSGNIYEDDNTRLAASVNGGYDTASGKANAGFGLMAEQKLDDSTKVYAAAGVTMNDLGGANDIGAAFNLGATFDLMPTKKIPAAEAVAAPVIIHSGDEPPPNLQSSAQSAQAAPVIKEAAAPAELVNIEKYDFLELSRKDKFKVLAMMAETYQSNHPAVSSKEAKDAIMKDLSDANYFVNSQGTPSQADDMPLSMEQVATR